MAEEKRFIPVTGTAYSSTQARPLGYASAQPETVALLERSRLNPNFLAPFESGVFSQPVLDNYRNARTEGYRPFFIDEFKKDPNSYYRFIGSSSMDWADESFIARNAALKDFIDSGQVRGELSNKVGATTYFSKGAANTAYLPEVRDARGETGRNLLYQLNKRFNAQTNPLYAIDAGFDGQQVLGQHGILLPKNDASWSETVNPANRRGVKITAFDTTERFVPKGTLAEESMMYTKPVSSEVLYDRTKPWQKTSFTQNLKNLGVEAKILGNAKLPSAVAPALGAAGGVLSMAGQVYGATRDNYYDRETGLTDPLGTRPAWDFMGKITGLYEDSNSHKGNSIQQAWREMGSQVKDPEYLMRNPFTGTFYNLAAGNTEPAKAFIDAYVPDFLKK